MFDLSRRVNSDFIANSLQRLKNFGPIKRLREKFFRPSTHGSQDGFRCGVGRRHYEMESGQTKLDLLGNVKRSFRIPAQIDNHQNRSHFFSQNVKSRVESLNSTLDKVIGFSFQLLTERNER